MTLHILFPVNTGIFITLFRALLISCLKFWTALVRSCRFHSYRKLKVTFRTEHYQSKIKKTMYPQVTQSPLPRWLYRKLSKGKKLVKTKLHSLITRCLLERTMSSSKFCNKFSTKDWVCPAYSNYSVLEGVVRLASYTSLAMKRVDFGKRVSAAQRSEAR